MTHRREHLLQFFALASAFGASSAGSTATLKDAISDLAHGSKTSADFGDTIVFFSGPTDQLKSMTAGTLELKPGREPHPPHQHPEEEFLVVTEGNGAMFLNNKWSDVGPGSILYSAGGHLHGIRNTGNTPLRFYFFKWEK